MYNNNELFIMFLSGYLLVFGLYVFIRAGVLGSSVVTGEKEEIATQLAVLDLSF